MTNVRILKSPEDLSHYDAWVKEHPQGTLWQSLAWQQYQEALGREVRVYVAGDIRRGCSFVASALVVIDRTTGGYSTWDIPRGPLLLASSLQLSVGGNIVQALLSTIIRDTREDHGLALSLSPPSPLDITESFRLEASHRHEQPTATRLIDLTQPEDAILAQMHPKGRYNIRVAQKNGVRVEQSQDIKAFYGLLQGTARRDGFRTLPLKAYRAFLESLPGSFLLMAFLPSSPATFPVVAPTPDPSPLRGRGEPPLSRSTGEGAGGWGLWGGGKPIAGLLGVIWGKTGIYYYGASDYASRSLMAPYALQWEAMRLCKGRGCTRYDLLGVTPRTIDPSPCPLPRGEGASPPQNHPWAGVSAFKEKFGGAVVTYPPEQQIALRPLLWRALQWKRKVIG